MLYYTDPNKSFKLETDASQKAYGGISRQDKNIVAIKSGKFNTAQLKYPPMEKELLAIIKCLEYF